jgi:hypothetical protein
MNCYSIITGRWYKLKVSNKIDAWIGFFRIRDLNNNKLYSYDEIC